MTAKQFKTELGMFAGLFLLSFGNLAGALWRMIWRKPAGETLKIKG